MSSVYAPNGRSVILENLRWGTYLALLADLGDHRGRLTFADGRLEILSPTPRHEHLKKLLGRLLEAFTEELNIKIQSVSSTTLNRKDLKKGVEADECYYIQNEARVRGKDRIDLKKDPPPDLAIEVEVTKRVLARLPIYAGMGVSEVWRWDGKKLRVCRLQEDGKYIEVDKSTVLPEFPIRDAVRFASRRGKQDETGIVRAFRRWVRKRFRVK